MKKIDLMLVLLFFTAFANVSFGQAVGLYPGGLTCEDAVPIYVATGFLTPNDGAHPAPTDETHDHWYSFVAPCSGELEITTQPYTTTLAADKRIHSGVCGSLTLERSSVWNDYSTNIGATGVALTEGETYYFEINDVWQPGSNGAQFDVNFENDACPQPSSLASFATAYDEAIIAWFAGGSETNWTVCYGPTGFDPAIEGTVIIVDGSPSATLTGLSELTCYDYYVQANCGGGEVSCFKSGPNTFCTPAICPAPLNPDESYVTSDTVTATWDAGATETAWDIEWGDEGFVLGTGTFIDGSPFDSEIFEPLEAGTCYDWYTRAECIVDLGDGPITVHSLWVGPNEVCTDNICLDPSGGTMIASGGLNATLGWTENNDPLASEWNIQYGTPGFSLGTGTTVTNIPTNPYTLGGLMPGTDYCYYVQAVCGEGEDSLSNWAGPYCFTTEIFCPAPSALYATGTSGTEADLSWELGDSEDMWEISWGLGLDDPDAGTIEDAAVFPGISLTGLTPGETYCYYVRANCGMDADSSSTWAGPFCWTQPALCATPFAVNVINITNTAAHVNFSSTGAETFDVEWGLPCFELGSGVGSETGVTEAPYYMTGLDHSTPYWVQVRAICGVDSVSAWSAPVLFGTDIANDDPCDAIELVLDGPAQLRHNFEATTLPGETTIAPPAADCYSSDGWCAGDGIDRTVWFKFEAPASGQVVLNTFDESTCFTNAYTEVAIYSTGDCGIITNFVPQYANTLAPGADGAEAPFGSELTACGLIPGQTYYVMVNPVAYIQTEVHFSISLSSVEEVAAGLGLSPTICAGSSYDLFDAIAGFTTEGGTWYNPVVADGNEFPNLIGFPDSPGEFPFYYVVDNGCDADTVMTIVTTVEGVDAGDDGFYTTCNDYDIVLSDHIVGSYEGGGLWEYDGVDPDVALAGGLFIPLGMDAGIYTFNYTVTSEYCATDTATITVVLIDCTELTEEAENALAVYPNPVVDVLTVQNISIEGNAVIEVLDIEGRVIISNQVANVFGNYEIDMSNIESGVYLVKVTAEDTVQKVRVVKQ
jgi:hypothetical protein